jgi:hypothetical protein
MFRTILFFLIAGLATRASAAENDPRWMITVTGGGMSRDADRIYEYGSLAATRKLGRSYLSASVTSFESAVRQVDVTLPSSYTIGFLSAGTARGSWFYDGYVALGRQHYKPVITDLGRRALKGSSHGPVHGAGVDLGYVKWVSPMVSVTPYASLQWIGSRALREQVTAQGASEYDTKERGSTLGVGLRVDRFFGPSRGHDISLRLTRFETNNVSAALSSGLHGAIDPASRSGRLADGWTELGGSVTWRVQRRVYLDFGATRTVGSLAGDMTTGSAGARLLF